MRFALGYAALALIAGASPVPAIASPVVQQVAVAPGLTLRVVDSGDPQSNQSLVFIPGWSAGADIWEGQIDRFDDDYRVVSFDPRSQGDSTKTFSGNTPEQRAADLRALLAAKKVDRPILIGWSQGAQDIAAYVLLYGSDDLAAIVLVDAAVSQGSKSIAMRPTQTSVQFDRLAIYAEHQEPYLRGMFGAIISKAQPADLVERLVATGMKTPPSIGIAMLVADLFGADRTSALAKIKCPVLVVASANSGELQAQRDGAAAIGNAQMVEIKDAAHAVFLDQPELFAAALADFAARVRSPAPAPKGANATGSNAGGT
jgi:microsomal epoxide hydrolase